jgi:membrane associated rhomboid family serine protease
MISLLVFQLIIDQIIPHIDVGAHLGGLVTGIALGLLLPISIEKQERANIENVITPV